MAFDGILTRALVHELKQKLSGGRIAKIAQPESEELLISFKTPQGAYKLFLSANASLPLCYLTENNKTSPLTAPNFCMLLRKHIGSGRILSITQPGLERIIDFSFEHLDEMGDVKKKHLMVEIMGKHSNIIFTNEEMVILDSIKHVPSSLSSVREVLPGRNYFIPDTQEKKDALTITESEFYNTLIDTDTLDKAIYNRYTGFSPAIVSEFLYRTSLDADTFVSELSEEERIHFSHQFFLFLDEIKENRFSPCIILDSENIPLAFSALSLTMYDSEPEQYHKEAYSSVSLLLEEYYSKKNAATNIRQKSADLRKVVQNLVERASKKQDLQQKQMKDTEKREKYRLYGELLNTYGYQIPEGVNKATLLNYYTNEDVVVPLDPTLTPSENAKKYFDKYGKQKRTNIALTEQLEETFQELSHLESIAASIDMAVSADDLMQIRQEMADSGYMKKAPTGKNGRRVKIISKPHHYRSSDGFDIYVGKNNIQNEELTFKFAEGGDIWMHAKKIPGSHVIIKTGGKEVPDRTYEEAGALAAFYSSAKGADKVEVDYIQKKLVKKPAGGKPGFVIYHNNYSLMAIPKIDKIQEVD